MLLLLATLLAFANAEAQDSASRPLIYASFSLSGGVTRSFGLNAGAACLFSRHHEIAVSYRLFSQPVDYEPIDFQFGGKHGGELSRLFEGVQVTYAYAINRSFWPGRLRYMLRGGLLIGRESIPYNFRPRAQTGPWDSNYDYDIAELAYAGFIVNPSVDITPGRVLGMHIGPFVVIGGKIESAGLTVGAILGSVGYLKWAPEARRIRGW
jgi:hypothetical protein